MSTLFNVTRTHSQGGGMGTLKGLNAGGRSSSLSIEALPSDAFKNEYALQSGKSEGKDGKPNCKKRVISGLST